MSEPIKNGDLVQVIRPTPCCNSGQMLGHTFVARKVGGGDVLCRICLRKVDGASAGDDIGFYYLLNRLKRIPPLSELESEKKKDEVPA